MKKKFIFFTMLLLTLMGGVKLNVLNAQDVVIGDGETTTSCDIPIPYGQAKSITQLIYTQSEIGHGAAAITSIAFKQQSASAAERDIVVFMKNTTKDSFTTSYDWETLSESDIVYEGTFTTATADQWVTITLSNQFAYEGGNLLVSILDNTGATDWNSYFYTYSTGTIKRARYYMNFMGSNVDPYNLSSKAGSYVYGNGSEVKNSQIKITFGAAAAASIEVTPAEFDFGETMLGNYWMENKPSQEVSIKTTNTSVTSVISDSTFFTVPNNIDFTTNPVVFNVGYDVNATAGEKTGVLKITYGDGEIDTVNMTATAYTPGEGDVWELAKKVTAYPFGETPAYANIHANYNLPGDGDAGKDVVYELNFTGDVLLTASVEGANAKLAVYQEGFGGQGGPKADNNYEGLQNDNGGGSSAPTTFGPYTFSDMTLEDVFTINDADVDGYKWHIYAYGLNEGPSLCSESYILGKGKLTPDNYIVTKQQYYITADSKLQFVYQSTYVEKFAVEVSTDGESFESVWVEPNSTGNVIKTAVIDLSEYAGQSVYIALRHYDCTDGLRLLIDDLALTDGSAKSRSVAQTRSTNQIEIDAVQFPAGKYYLVASATEEFTVNIATDEVPAPAAFALTAPEDDAREQNNPKLAWEAAKYASSYNVYIGASSDLSDADTVEVTTNSYQTEGLSNNTKYYWTVEAVNEQGTTSTTSGTCSFVTTLDVPQNISANPTQIYEGESTMISWSAPENTNGLYYNIYVNGELLKGNLEDTSYEIQDLGHNIDGHEISVTAVYDGLGESGHAKCNVQVCGYGNMDITVKDGETPIKGATVVLNGTDAFGNAVEEFTGSTNEAGVLLVENVKAGEYTVAVSKFGYEEKVVTGIVVESGTPYEATISMQEKPTAPEDLLKDDVAVEEDYFDGTAIVTWTGAYNNTQMYNIYRKNVETDDVELVDENQNGTYSISKSYTDADYATLPDGKYQYGVTTMVDVDEVILNEGFESGKFPEGWINNQVYYYGYDGWALEPSNANNGTYCIENYFSQDNYTVSLETSTIDLTSYPSATLSFYYVNKPYNSSYKQSIIKIKVKKHGGSWEYVKTISENVANYRLCEISLNEYVGNQIQIAFECHTSAWGYSRIDDIVLSVGSKTESAPVWSNEIKKGGIVFTNAGGDNRWDNENNWSNNTVPGAEDEVTIKATATISSNVNVKYLAISGGALTINSGATLTVTGELVNNDEYNLTINDGAQVFHNSENVKARFAMNIVAPETWSSENTDGWQFIAAPFVNNTAPIANFTSPNSSTIVYDLYKYNGVNAGAEWDNQKDNSGTWGYYFENGVGYLASYPQEGTAYLNGTLNNASSHTWNFTYNNDEKPLANFHLLGNPFTFNMDMTKAEFTNLVKGVAIVNNEGGYSYDVDTIPVGDGFFVQATNENPSFSYPAASKATRGEKANSLNVIATSNAGNDNVVINFVGKSEGFNKLQNFNDAIATVYVAEDGKNYGIYNCDADVQEVELYFNANKMGNYTISIEPNGEFETVTLVDRFTGVETNMLLEDYNFTAMSSDNHNRFIVRMVNRQQTTDNSHFVYQSGEELILNIQGDVQIVDVLGRVVYNGKAMNDINRINVSSFNSGAYMIRVMNGNDVKVEKVVIY